MVANSFEHAEDARAALREIVAHYGPDTLSDPAAMSNLLKDLLPDNPRVARVLVAAAEDRIADVLRDHLAQGLDGPTAARLAASTLASATMFTPDVCHWVVAEIAAAMGLPAANQRMPTVGDNIQATAHQPAEATVNREPVPIPPDSAATMTAAGPYPGADAAANPTPTAIADLPSTTPQPVTPATPASRGVKLPVSVVVTVVMLVVVGVGVAAALHGATNSATVQRPTGLTAGKQTFSTISLNWNKPAPDAQPTRYEVFSDGRPIASIAGSATSYLVTGLSPSRPYSFRLVAIRGKKHSPASATLSAVTAAPPPVSAARLRGPFTVSYSDPRFTGIRPYKLVADEWQAAPNCASGACSVRLSGQFQGFDFADTVLRKDGPAYTGRTTLRRYFTCDKKPEISYLTIRLQVTAATALGSLWQVTGWSGSFTLTSPPAYTCSATSISAHVSGN